MDGEEDEDAFSDDSAAYMEDMMMLRADGNESEAPATLGRAGAGAGAGAADSGGGGRKRAGVVSSGGSVSGAMSMEEEEEEEDEEEFSEPGEGALQDDESTLVEVRAHRIYDVMASINLFIMYGTCHLSYMVSYDSLMV